MVVCTLAHEHLEAAVPGSEGLKEIPDLLLAHRFRKIILSLVETVGGYIRIEVVQRADPYPVKHHADIFLRLGKIAEL